MRDDEYTTPDARAAAMAGKWWADKLAPKFADRAESFAAQVTLYVLGELMEHGVCCTEVDYDTDALLDKALHYAGIDEGRFMAGAGAPLPIKHELTIYPDHLEPKEGYGNWTPDIAVPLS